jgi:cysteine-rich repeat protein
MAGRQAERSLGRGDAGPRNRVAAQSIDATRHLPHTPRVRRSQPPFSPARSNLALALVGALLLPHCTLDTQGALDVDLPDAPLLDGAAGTSGAMGGEGEGPGGASAAGGSMGNQPGAGGSGGDASGSGGVSGGAAGEGGKGGAGEPGGSGPMGEGGSAAAGGGSGDPGGANAGGQAGSSAQQGGEGGVGTAGTDQGGAGGAAGEAAGGVAGAASPGGAAGAAGANAQGGPGGAAAGGGPTAGGSTGDGGASGEGGTSSAGGDAGAAGASGASGGAGASGAGGEAGASGAGGAAGAGGGAGAGGAIAGMGGSSGESGAGGSSGAGGAAGAAGAGGAGATCGDGMIEAGEQCDPGGDSDPRCILCQAACAPGELPSEDGLLHCYWLETLASKQDTWDKARDACLARGPGCDLAAVNSASELAFLQSKAGLSGPDVWVGGRLVGATGTQLAFGWSSKEPWAIGPTQDWFSLKSGPGGPQSPPWAAGQPDFADEGCVELHAGFGYQLNNLPCDAKANYLCECEPVGVACDHDGFIDPNEQCDDGNMLDGDGCSAHCKVECAIPAGSEAFAAFVDPLTNLCYLMGPNRTWQESLDQCGKLGPGFSLAKVKTEASFGFLISRPEVGGQAWVDGSDIKTEGKFVFSDGSPVPFPGGIYPWRAGEPNNTGNNEDCAEILLFGSTPKGKFLNDAPCDEHHDYICERPPAGQ